MRKLIATLLLTVTLIVGGFAFGNTSNASGIGDIGTGGKAVIKSYEPLNGGIGDVGTGGK